MTKTRLSITALLLGATTLVQATDGTLSPVLVTATRTAQTMDDTLASVTVISREVIEQSQAASVVELLQQRSVGIDLSRNGGLGTTTSLRIRGGNSNHVLVLIDGIRANSSIDGDFKWHNLPLEQIERIEIVRGPRSTLYGSDAIGGVIQIFTRQGEGYHLSIGGGSYSTRSTKLGAAGNIGKARLHLNAGYLQSEGFSVKQPGTYGYEPDDDGYLNRNLGAGIAYPLGGRTELKLNLLHSEGEVDYDNASPTNSSSSTQRNDSASLALEHTSSESWQQNLTLGHGEDHYETSDGYTIHSLRDSASWQHDLQLNDTSLLTAGIDYSEENGESEGDYDEDIANAALFAQYQWNSNQLDLLLGARSDDFGRFGQHETGSITLGGKVGDRHLYLSYGSAFKAPTFLQRYYPTYGNPNLLPEESVTTELGYRHGGLQISLYDTYVDNLIEFNFPTGYANLSRAHLQGAELEYGREVNSWQWHSGLTLQKAENDDTGEQLLRRAEKKLFFNASGPLGANTNVGIEASYTGPRLDRGDVELASFTLVNLTGEYHITERLSLKGRAENLLDEEYMLANGYNTPGASAYLSLHYSH